MILGLNDNKFSWNNFFLDISDPAWLIISADSSIIINDLTHDIKVAYHPEPETIEVSNF